MRLPFHPRARAAAAAVLALAAACESAATAPARTTAPAQDAPAAAVPSPAAPTGAPAATLLGAFTGTARATGTAVDVRGSGNGRVAVVQVSKSGGYTGPDGRVVQYQFRDSVAAVNAVFSLAGGVQGGGLTLVVPGAVPAPGTYTVLELNARPPFALGSLFFASYGTAGCAYTYVGERGTLTVTRSAAGELQGTVDVQLRAAQRGVFVSTTIPAGAGCEALTGVAGTPPRTLQLAGSFDLRAP
jgi:hypothetical protein